MKERAVPAEPEASSICLLVVEDHADSLHALSRLLEIEGYHVCVARSFREALAQAEQHPIDLLVSDIGLPDGSGLDLIRELRQRYGLRGVAVSGYAHPADVAAALKAGYECHISKPLDLPRLLETVARLTTRPPPASASTTSTPGVSGGSGQP